MCALCVCEVCVYVSVFCVIYVRLWLQRLFSVCADCVCFWMCAKCGCVVCVLSVPT